MKMDTKHPDPRIILSERFRSAQEVMDRGFQIMGSGVTFPGNGVKFTGTAGQRLSLTTSPPRTFRLLEFSCHISFTPSFSKDENVDRSLFDRDGLGYIWIAPVQGGLFVAAAGDTWKVAATNANYRAAWRDYQKNWLSFSVKNGEQRIWMNGILIGSAALSPMPGGASGTAASINIGSYSGWGAFAAVFNGTIHSIDWYSKTMTIEDHLDFMHNDTYSEVF